MRENGPLLSRVVDPPETKGGPRAGNFSGPPKNTFCPGWSHDPGQKALLSRVVDSPGTKRGGPHPYISLLPPPSPTLGGFLDLRHAVVVPCSHRASCSLPPSSPSAADLRRPSSAAPSRRRSRAPPSPSAVDVPHRPPRAPHARARSAARVPSGRLHATVPPLWSRR